jgi:hypothetical protein
MMKRRDVTVLEAFLLGCVVVTWTFVGYEVGTLVARFGTSWMFQ